MTANVLWDQFRASTGRQPLDAGAPEEQERTGLVSFIRSGEMWLTLALVSAAFMAVIYSIESANWVREMPSLVVAGAIGLITGWLLAYAPLPSLPAHIVGVLSGFAVAVGQTLHTMRLEDPLLSSGPAARWGEMWGRLGEWVSALVTGGISNDPLPFVLLVVFGVWAMSYMASWAVFRLRNAWLALVPGGFALLTNISYLPGQPAEEFIVFLFAAMLLVTRLHYLRALAEWTRQRTWRAPYLSFEVFSFATWIGLTLIIVAWVMPTANNWGPLANAWTEVLRPVSDRVDRIGQLFIGVGSKRDRHLHTFAGALPLQGSVTLNGQDVLLRVTAPEPLYLRGAVYDRYTGDGWTVSDATTLPLLGTTVEAASFGTPATREQLRRTIIVDITIEESVVSRRLFSAGDPVTSDVESRLLTSRQAVDPIGLVPASRVQDGDTYTTVGTVSAASVAQLLASGSDYPQAIRDRYLQLPSDLPPEVAELAAEVTAGLRQPYAITRRVEVFLRDRYEFDLDAGARPSRTDGVAYFLFDAQRGYFDHYASAMAVMLRTLGVPARVVTGFALDDADFDSETKSYAVTEERAWAWPEVYFEGFGWVEFNPTPAAPLVSRPGEDSGLFDPASALSNASGLDLEEQFLLDLLNEIENIGGVGGVTAINRGGDGFGELIAAVLTWLSLGVAFVIAALVGARALWVYWFRGLAPAASRWAKLQQLGAWAGMPVRVNLTPLENAARLTEVLGEDSDLEPLARAYTRERYGVGEGTQGTEDGAAAEEEQDRLSTLYAAARGRLFRLAVRRRLGLRRRLPRREQPSPAA